MKQISSAANPLIKEAARLRKAGARQERGLILIDGAREIAAAVGSGLAPETVFYCPALAGPDRRNFFGLADDKLIEVTADIFHKISHKENPDGWLALAPRPERRLSDIRLGKAPLVMILEKVEKPGNLGAILRTAYAVGADAVIMNDNQTDIYNPNVIRASEGYVFTETAVSASLPDTIAWLKKNKIKSFAAATSATRAYTEVDWSGASAIVLGSEADGLSEAWLEAADDQVKIPMKAGLDSLNVSVTAAVIAFEAIRQRRV